MNSLNDAYDSLLITGGSGWLGKNLLYFLKELDRLRFEHFDEVRVFLEEGDDSLEEPFRSAVNSIHGDLRNPKDCRRFFQDAPNALLIHTAGVVHPPRVRDFYEVNVEGTRNVLEAGRNQDLKKALLVSSNSAFGFNLHLDHHFDEFSRYNPQGYYGRSKKQLEEISKRFHERGWVKTVIIRPPWFYGPFQPERQIRFFKLIRSGRIPRIGTGENQRSMIFLPKLCEALVLAGEAEDISGEDFWIADAEPYTYNHILETVRGVLRRKGYTCEDSHFQLPNLFGFLASQADRIFQALGVYWKEVHVLSELNKSIACSSDKAQRILGYTPNESLKPAMSRSIESAIENGRLPEPPDESHSP